MNCKICGYSGSWLRLFNEEVLCVPCVDALKGERKEMTEKKIDRWTTKVEDFLTEALGEELETPFRPGPEPSIFETPKGTVRQFLDAHPDGEDRGGYVQWLEFVDWRDENGNWVRCFFYVDEWSWW